MLAGAALAALVLATPAAAAATPEPVLASGSITYSWQGDPAHGCGAVGVCNVVGALIADVAGPGSVTRLAAGTVLNLDDTRVTVRVLSGSGSTATTCIDGSAAAGGPGLFVTGRRRGALRARFEAGLSSGRCAGPLAADLGRLDKHNVREPARS